MPMFDDWPGDPSNTRLGMPSEMPLDSEVQHGGDVDCDMLADADEFGLSRSPASDSIMRRAVRERGIKVRYHGGSVSALW